MDEDDIRDITGFPHVEASIDLVEKDREVWAYGSTTDSAIGRCAVLFQEKYGREPNWDIVMFRGCFTTFQVVFEMWEES
jgi:hypothetical protein